MEKSSKSKPPSSIEIDNEQGERSSMAMELPPGFRFHPTDEEIISHYLKEKVLNSGFNAIAIGEADFNKCEPWDLPKKAKMGEKEWYFFCQRDRKYPTGMRTNRATESGYWKATGKDKEIYTNNHNTSKFVVGMKKTLVFYTGRAPKGQESNWVMHEFRLHDRFSFFNLPHNSAKDEWVVCRVFHKNNVGINNNSNKKLMINNNNNNNIQQQEDQQGLLRINSFGVDDMLDSSNYNYNSLPPLITDDHYHNDYFLNKPTTSHLINNNNYYTNNNSNSLLQNPILFYSQQQQQPVNNNNNNNNNNNHMIPNNYSSSSSFPAAYNNNNNNSTPTTSTASGFDHRHCKAEQFSNNMVSLSQDTGLSTDNINTEISSVLDSNKQQFDQHHFQPPGFAWDDF